MQIIWFMFWTMCRILSWVFLWCQKFICCACTGSQFLSKIYKSKKFTAYCVNHCYAAQLFFHSPLQYWEKYFVVYNVGFLRSATNFPYTIFIDFLLFVLKSHIMSQLCSVFLPKPSILQCASGWGKLFTAWFQLSWKFHDFLYDHKTHPILILFQQVIANSCWSNFYELFKLLRSSSSI